jgi:L-ribulokinase
VAGVYDKVEDAQKSMGQGFTEEYHPNPEMARFYEAKYREYRQLGELTEKAFYSTI